MGRLSEEDRQRNEQAIRAAMDRLLRGDIPHGGRCDLKTLASQAGVTRTGFYPKGDRPGPYQHLAEEFERHLRALQDAGESPDPRDAQITRLKTENTRLKERLNDRDTTVQELTVFKALAISRLAAQHQEIEQLRSRQPPPAAVRQLPRSTPAH
jgi:hypothetical protein